MKRGQALVEFIIILPIFLMLLLSIIDVGKILYTKNSLESELTSVISLYEKGKDKEEINQKLESKNLEFTLNEEKENIKFTLTKKIEIITPGLNLILKNPYLLKVSRSIPNENE